MHFKNVNNCLNTKLLLLKDTWPKFSSIFKCCSFFQNQCKLDSSGSLRQLFSCIGVQYALFYWFNFGSHSIDICHGSLGVTAMNIYAFEKRICKQFSFSSLRQILFCIIFKTGHRTTHSCQGKHCLILSLAERQF